MSARLSSLIIVGAAAALVSGCVCAQRDRYLIPDGYVGPVVVVYRALAGTSEERDEDGVLLYRIAVDGTLYVRGAGPREGPVRSEYFYVAKDGTRTSIPWNPGSEDVNQVFGVQVGSVSDARWLSFIVGSPHSRPDWPELRLRLLERALDIQGQLIPEADAPSAAEVPRDEEER
jgi:hypothetical protein